MRKAKIKKSYVTEIIQMTYFTNLLIRNYTKHPADIFETFSKIEVHCTDCNCGLFGFSKVAGQIENQTCKDGHQIPTCCRGGGRGDRTRRDVGTGDDS